MSENALARETSPYLLQHKDNPVDWHPWGREALALAKSENKPILLSIGYAACHWCHVMAHECFEDPAIADVMNQHFVNIKVDREERPDLDTIYQSSLAILGEQGGWPLTMFLTPDGEPFWGGTYFPPTPRFGRPGFPEVLRRLATIFASEQDKVGKNVAAIREALQQLANPNSGGMIPPTTITAAAERLHRSFDPINGGLGGAPKFPQPAILKLLWRAWQKSESDSLRQAVELTLTRMCQGGIYDHLGGGFARYSVDQHWLAPHFEKMLYDNAQLIDVLTLVWQETGNRLFEMRVRETIAWVLREMIASDGGTEDKQGGFASTLDADSEGEEGKFYVWDAKEIDSILGNDAPSFKDAYEVTTHGNWEGHTILNRLQRPDLGDPDYEAGLAAMRGKLLLARSKRVRPGWDDKVLADWNGLMIAALVRAAAAFDEPVWLNAAEQAFDFIVQELTVDDRLMHSYRHGQVRHSAMLDDYANMAEAALALYEATAKERFLDQAIAWIDVLNRHYWDSDHGGYFQTANDAEDLIVRTKSAHDNAVPAGNSTLLGVLARLYYLTGDAAYRDRAERLLFTFSGELQRNFIPYITLIINAEILYDPLEIVIIGEKSDPETRAMLKHIHAHGLLNRILQVIDDPQALPARHPASGKVRQDGHTTAYVCRGARCSLPVINATELAETLRGFAQ